MKLPINAISIRTIILVIGTVAMSNALVVSAEEKSGFKEGATMVAKVNLHPDQKRKVLYALNYQLPSILPMCAKVKIEDIGKKEIEFVYQGITYRYLWDKHTKKAGQSLEENFKQYFGTSCEDAKVANLSQADQDGIKSGQPQVGMTKEGILFTMGRPPIHATPTLETNTWMYWSNKWVRKAIDFDDKGVVTQIR
ncbi:outer membrane protein assembly factor BamE [uncultured Paraglaciecola sp.]|uniref:outer membrane protein assembly factor BamE domain-containing protein n=1 Tax=uncultured Paraglaciecola sp. TaxID=1765024 RepID=UPI0030DD5D93|tara:strand:+ start:23608 stop:24192 length:585 start_codon:yes stop_codon:yes gene_type:complete